MIDESDLSPQPTGLKFLFKLIIDYFWLGIMWIFLWGLLIIVL